jgi:molybdate transport system substrate-binding protein
MKKIVLAVFIVAACGTQPLGAGPTPVKVFAAASLTDAFKALGIDYGSRHPSTYPTFNFAGTPTLLTQLEQGAQADVFASADTANMDKLQSDGLSNGQPKVFAHNLLEIVVAPGNPKGIASLADLAKPGVIYISAGPTVPAGKYALQALAKAGVNPKPRSLETDVKSVISKIELGEADAGIVYATDVTAAGTKVQGVVIPDTDNVVATYPLVEVKGARNPDGAASFVGFVLSSEGQATLAKYGFQHA